MEAAIHPMDEALAQRDWRRACLDDLQNDESTKLAARLLCRALTLSGTRPLMGMIDVHLWLQDGVVRMDLATPQVPSFLEVMVAQGLSGVVPHALGLVPCLHEPWHWNPFCLPLIWRQEMNLWSHMDAFAQLYAQSLKDTSWQCPDAARLMW